MTGRHDSERLAPERLALLGIAVNALLAAGKLTAGVLGNSFALVADAVESLVDIAGSVVVWSAMRYGSKPADAEHPFGHGKIEPMAAMAVAMVIVLAGIGVAVESVRQIITPQSVPRPYTLLVLVVVIVVKESLARVADRAAKRAKSSAGAADAWHHRSDAITSAFAFIGIAVAVIGGPGFARADDIAALLASGVIVLNGFLLAREPYHELLDRHSPEIADEVAQIAMGVPGVLGVEQCDARQSGRGYRVVMHVEVDPKMTVAEAHAITGRIKAEVRSKRADIDSVLIHIEPHDETG
ncbi:MAG: cation transporter [Phycisphaerales bacterium]|nr:cation transporter [Phycisphaerales bacterium]MCB9837161.1 cation transporter [Phycisphaera sp.]